MTVHGGPAIHDDERPRKSDVLAEDGDREDSSIKLGDRVVSLSRFLTYCGSSLSGKSPLRGDEEFERARDLFVRAGLDALAAAPIGNGWVQIGIHPLNDPVGRRELYSRLSDLARRLLRDRVALNFFHMNKEPGMRLRFENAGNGAPDLADVLYTEAARWQADGLVLDIEPGVYEAESEVFGGPISMSYAHDLFTIDSLAWLDFQSSPMANSEDGSPAWLASLSMLRPLFDGLGIIGWEDIGVWETVRESTGRRLAEEVLSSSAYADTAKEIRALWQRPNDLVEQLHPAIRPRVADQQGAIRAAADRWRFNYFNSRAAYIGPRAAAAFYVIFHWNRGALSAMQQALLTESLYERRA